MPMVSLRIALLSVVAPLALMSPALAQDASTAPRLPDITPGVLVAPSEASTSSATPPTPSVPPIPEVWAPVPRDAEGRSAYGLYVAGRVAMSRGEGPAGSAYLAAAETLTPEQPRVREQAFLSSLISGDLNDAARILPTGPGVSPVISEVGRLVAVVQTYARGDAEAAMATLRDDPIQAPHAVAAVFALPWIAAEAGDWDLALIAPVPGSTDGVSQYMRFSRAQLLEIHRRHDDAEAEFKTLTALAPQEPLFRVAYGEFLERRGRRDEALALYDAAIAAGARDTQTSQARQRVSTRGRPPAVTTLRDGMATGLVTAAQAVAGQGGAEFAAVYLRLALNVAPTDERRLVLGRILFDADRDAEGRAVLAEVGPRNPGLFAAAHTQIAQSLLEDEEPELALAEYERASAVLPENPLLAYLQASTLIQLQRYDEALTLLNGPMLNTAAQGAEVHFMRGAAYESLDRIPEAEAELWAALQKQPEEPTFLNYLGYLWVDSGLRVQEGAALIARAHAAEPEDGNIQDSLGWAQFRQGQYDVAVVTLEEAVAKEPANAEINDHLGDAYWQVGRQREAGFQWTRVLTLEPDAERRAEVEQKLVSGLTPPVPLAGGSKP